MLCLQVRADTCIVHGSFPLGCDCITSRSPRHAPLTGVCIPLCAFRPDVHAASVHCHCVVLFCIACCWRRVVSVAACQVTVL